MVLVGTGAVDHQELVSLAEKHFSSLPVSPNPIPLGRLSHPKTEFIGSEVRVRNDELPTAHIAIAVEGVGWNSPDYFPMLVMQSIFGNWDRSLGSSSLLSSRLSHIISSNNLANSFMSFSTSYSDTGLWGIYLVSENLMNLDDLAHFTLREWTRMSIAPTEVEVERAKSQLKASILLGLDGTTAIAEDIGRQVVTSGRRMTPKQIEFAIDTVTPAEIQRVAQKYLWDKDVRHVLCPHQFSPFEIFIADCSCCCRFDRRPPRLQSYPQRHVLYDLLMRRNPVYGRPTIKIHFHHLRIFPNPAGPYIWRTIWRGRYHFSPLWKIHDSDTGQTGAILPKRRLAGEYNTKHGHAHLVHGLTTLTPSPRKHTCLEEDELQWVLSVTSDCSWATGGLAKTRATDPQATARNKVPVV